MAAYESIFILRPDLDDEAVAKICDRISAVVNDNQGSVIALEKTGRRRLAYEVKGQLEGFYVILNFEGKAATTAELERTYKISDEVIRYIIVKREVPYKPAPVREAAPKEAGAAEAPAAAGEAEASQEAAPPAAEALAAPAEAVTEGSGEAGTPKEAEAPKEAE